MKISIDRGMRRKLRGHWIGNLTPLADSKIRPIKDLSLILKIGMLSRSINGTCSFHIGGVGYDLSVNGRLMGKNTMSLDAIKTNYKFPEFNMILQIVATLDSSTLVTGKALISGGSFGHTIMVADLRLEKQ